MKKVIRPFTPAKELRNLGRALTQRDKIHADIDYAIRNTWPSTIVSFRVHSSLVRELRDLGYKVRSYTRTEWGDTKTYTQIGW